MVPVAWVQMPALPLTANGKVDARAAARADARALRPRRGRRRPRRREPARARGDRGLRDGARPPPGGAEDDFFALGGHSLLALALCAELRRRTGARLRAAPRSSRRRRRARWPPRSRRRRRTARWDNDGRAASGEGSRPPLFVVTAGDGNPLGVRRARRAASTPSCRSTRCSRSGLDGRRRSTAASRCSPRATCARSAAAAARART